MSIIISQLKNSSYSSEDYKKENDIMKNNQTSETDGELTHHQGKNQPPSTANFISQNQQEKIFSIDFVDKALIPEFSLIISVIFRTMIIAILVFVIIKWLGGKGLSHLSPFGLIIVVGLGSAVGDPMIYKNISIPQSMAAVIIVIVFFKIIDYLTLRSKKFRRYIEPGSLLLIEYGEINKEGLRKARLGIDDIYMQMRLKGIENLSNIKFARLEKNGEISFIQGRRSNKELE